MPRVYARVDPYERIMRSAVRDGDCLISMLRPKEKYSRVRVDRAKDVLVHRLVWERHHGPVPPGHHVHHRCHRHRCVNIDHLEAKPKSRHIQDHKQDYHPNRDKTRCARGHAFSQENTKVRPDGSRRCLMCQREDNQRRAVRERNERSQRRMASSIQE